MTFYVNGIKRRKIVHKMSQIVVTCRKLSWHFSQIVVTFFFPSPSRRPLLVFADWENLHRANGRGGFGSQTAADPPLATPRQPEKQTVGAVTASHKMLSLQALSSSLNASTAKRGSLSRGKAFEWPLAVCPPKRPRPFTHYREKLNRGVSKPEGSPTFFGKGPDCVADPFGTVPRRCS